MEANNIDNKGKKRKSKKILSGKCIFPFKYKGKKYNNCAEGNNGEWCATEITKKGYAKKWGFCIKKTQKKLSDKKSSSSSKKNKKSLLSPLEDRVLLKKISKKSSYNSSDGLEVKKIDGIFTSDPRNFELFKGTPQITNKWLLKLYELYKSTGCILFRNITNWLPLEYYDKGVGLFYSDYTTLGKARCITELSDVRHRYIFYLLVIRTQTGGFHANSIIMDLNKKKVWRFEPNGKVCSFYSQREIDKSLKEYYAMFDMIYVSPSEYQTDFGPQVREVKAGFEVIEGQSDGFCAAWSSYFIHLFLENNKGRKYISVEQLENTLNDQSEEELAIDIRGYMGYIMRNIAEMRQIAKDGEGDDEHDLEL